MFFRLAKNVFISFRYDGLADRAHSARGQLNRRITKITRNVNAPLYDGLMTARTVIAVNQNCRIGERPAYRGFLTRASMGKSNYYDQMK